MVIGKSASILSAALLLWKPLGALASCDSSHQIYFNDFNSGSSSVSDWGVSKWDDEGELGKFMGRFGNGNTKPEQTFDVSRYTNFDSIVLEFDFLEIDSWDKNSNRYGDDRFYVFINDEEIDCGNFQGNDAEENRSGRTTSNIRWSMIPQGAPAQLGYKGGRYHTDQIHKMTFIIPRSVFVGGKLKIKFDPRVNQSSSDESGAIDNVRITAGNGCYNVCQGGVSAYTWGDPHLVTFDGRKFDCQARGEFILIKSLTSSLQVNGRFEKIDGSHPANQKVMYTTGIAMSYDAYPKVQVFMARDSSTPATPILGCPVRFYVDGTEKRFGDSTGDSSVTVVLSGSTIVIDYADIGLSGRITVQNSRSRGCYFRFNRIYISQKLCEDNNILGLLGTPNDYVGDEWNNPQGGIVPFTGRKGQGAYDYCTTNWCVTSAGNSLFEYESATYGFDYFNKCPDPFPGDVDISNPPTQLAEACGGDEVCLIDGTAGDVEDGVAALQDQADLLAERASQSACKVEPPSVLAGVSSNFKFIVNIDGITGASDVQKFNVYQADPDTGEKDGSNPTLVLVDDGSGVDATSDDDIFTASKTLTLQSSEVYPVVFIPVINGEEDPNSALNCVNLNAITAYTPAVSLPLINAKCLGGISAFTWGDPHLVTFDGRKFDCQARGEFVLIKSLSSSLEVRGRFEKIEGVDPSRTHPANNKVTYTTGVALKYDGYPTAQLSIARSSDASTNAPTIAGCPVRFFVDSTEVDITAGSYSSTDFNAYLSGTSVYIKYTALGLEARLKVYRSQTRGCYFRQSKIFISETLCTANPLVGLLGVPDGDPRNEWNDETGAEVPGFRRRGQVAFDYCTGHWCITDSADTIFAFESGTNFDTFNYCPSTQLPDSGFPGDVDLSNPPQELVDVCGTDETCLTDGLDGGVDDAIASTEDQAECDAEQAALSGCKFEPGVAKVGQSTPINVQIDINSVVGASNVQSFAMYMADTNGDKIGSKLTDLLDDGAGADITLGDLIFSGTHVVSPNSVGDVYAFTVIPVIGGQEDEASPLSCTNLNAVTVFSDAIETPQTNNVCKGGGICAFSWGDPHLVTFDGRKFDCQGRGEFTLIKSLSSSLEVQGRFGKQGSYAKVTYTTGLVFKYDGWPTVQVSMASVDFETATRIGRCPVRLFVDNAELPIMNGSPDPRVEVTVSGSIIYVSYTDLGLTARIKSYYSRKRGCFFRQSRLCISQELCEANSIIGLLGVPNNDINDEWNDSTGARIPFGGKKGFKPYNYCTTNWCVTDSVNSLFSYETGTTFDTFGHCLDQHEGDIDTSNPDPEVAAICGTDEECLTDGEAGGPEDAQACVEDETEADEEQNALSSCQFNPGTIYAGSTVDILITVNIAGLVGSDNVESFSLYEMDQVTEVAGLKLIDLLDTGVSPDVTSGDLIFSGTYTVTGTQAGEVFGFVAVPVNLGGAEVPTSSLTCERLDAVTTNSGASLMPSSSPSAMPTVKASAVPTVTESDIPSSSPSFCGGCKILDFNTDGDGNAITGTPYVQNEWYDAYGVFITATGGFSPNGKARLYDTTYNATDENDGDPDLGSPNSGCPGGGPGSGSHGAPMLNGQPNPGANCDGEGYVVIIQESDKTYADDNSGGGTLTFDFRYIATVNSIGLMDIDENGGDWVEVITKNGTSHRYNVLGLGDNSIETVLIGRSDVEKLIVHFPGSGAVREISYCNTCEPGETFAPSGSPTSVGSSVPTVVKSASPSGGPSSGPTVLGSSAPTAMKSAYPTITKSAAPTTEKSAYPTITKSAAPTTEKSAYPTITKSAAPTTDKSARPSLAASSNPSTTYAPSFCGGCLVLDFNTDGHGNPVTGTPYGTPYVQNEWYDSYGVFITAEAEKGGFTPYGKARLYDTRYNAVDDNDGDPDLGSPNENCPGGGPGRGTHGGPMLNGQPNPGANCRGEGYVLIIQESDKINADDNTGGGRITIDFKFTAYVKSIGLMDIDELAGDWVEVITKDGTSYQYRVAGLGDNSIETVEIGRGDVEKLVVHFPGSGAIREISYCNTCELGETFVPSASPSRPRTPGSPPTGQCELVVFEDQSDPNFCEDDALCRPYRYYEHCAATESFLDFVKARRDVYTNNPASVSAGGHWYHIVEDKLATKLFAQEYNYPAAKLLYCSDDVESLLGWIAPASVGLVVKAVGLHSGIGVFVLPNGFGGEDLLSGVNLSQAQVKDMLDATGATRFLIEEYKSGPGGVPVPNELMLHMFGGEVGSMIYVANRGLSCECFVEMDEDWNRLDQYGCFRSAGNEAKTRDGECTLIEFRRRRTQTMKGLSFCSQTPPRPDNLSEIIATAKTISQRINVYIRIDLLIVDNGMNGTEAIVGEFTPGHSNGRVHCSARLDENGCIDSCFLGRMWKENGGDLLHGGSATAIPPSLASWETSGWSTMCSNYISSMS